MNTLQRDISSTAIGSPFRDKCHTSGSNYLSPSNACNYGSGNKRITVFGDSHVVPIAYALSNNLLNYSIINSWWIDAGTEERIKKLKELKGIRIPGERRHKNRMDTGPRNINEELVNKIKSLS